MALELIRDLLRVDQVIGEEMTQAVVEGDIVVPDSKPDIHKVLSIDGDVIITDKEVMDDRIMIEGAVNVRVLYTSQEGEQPLYYMEGNFGIAQQLDVAGVNSRMDAEVHADIEHIDTSMVNSRKLNVRCVLNFSGKALDRSHINIIKEAKGIQDIQILKDYIEVSSAVGQNGSHATVRQEFEVSADKPPIREILKTDVSVGERDSRITEDKISIQGIINVSTLYIGDDEEGSINHVRYQIPFSHYIEIPGAAPGMRDKTRYSVEDFYSTVKENTEGQRRIIEYEVVVKAEGRVEESQQMEVMVDAYSPSTQIKLEKSSLKLKKTLDSIIEEITIKEEVSLPGECPGIEEICDVEATPVLTDFGISDDALVVEGVLSTKVLYVTDNSEEKVYVYQDEIPFRHSMALPEDTYQVDIDVDFYLENLQHRKLDPDLVEVRGQLRIEVEISRSFEREVVVDMEEAEEVERQPQASIIVYVVQPGDTLWNIAKRYSTTIDELVKINDLEEPESLTPGQKLIISRIVKYKLS